MKTNFQRLTLLLALFTILSLPLSGCMAIQQGNSGIQQGQVVAVQMGQTVNGMLSAYHGEAGTGLMQFGNQAKYVFLWSLNDGWAFAGVSAESHSAFDVFKTLKGGGNFTTAKDMSDLVAVLKDNGWKVISPDQLPPAVVTGLSMASGWLQMAASSFTTFIVLPAGVDADEYLKNIGIAPNMDS